jgi:hypothetical protein
MLAIEFPGLFTRLLSLGSARDVARSSLEDLAGRAIRGYSRFSVENPDFAARLLLDCARRPRGNGPR